MPLAESDRIPVRIAIAVAARNSRGEAERWANETAHRSVGPERPKLLIDRRCGWNIEHTRVTRSTLRQFASRPVSIRRGAIPRGNVFWRDVADAPAASVRLVLEQQWRGIGDMLLQQLGAEAEDQNV